MVTPEIKGAYTGAISATMLKSIGVQWVLAGHSERRTINKETDDYINAQCGKIIENGMNVILCIGETLTEFEKNLAGPVCAIQLKKGLAGISAQQVLEHVCVAYEPGTYVYNVSPYSIPRFRFVQQDTIHISHSLIP